MEITAENLERIQRGVIQVELDGRPLEGNIVPHEQAFIKHRVGSSWCRKSNSESLLATKEV